MKTDNQRQEAETAQGFKALAQQIDEAVDKLAAAVAAGFEETREGFAAADRRFDAIEKRLDRIENVLIASHDRRLDLLEDSMRQVKTALHL